MQVIVQQAERPHNGNQLHDEMIAAGLAPDPVHVYEDRTELTFADKKDAEKAKGVIAAHAKKERPKPADRQALREQARAAKTVAELRDVVAEMLA